MALQVWLPLNGNLNNQGLTNTTVTNNGATVDNNGKIGKCYSFNGSSNYLRINEKLIDNAQYTISFWMYATNVTANQCIYSSRNVSNGAVNIYLLSTGLRFDYGTNWVTGFKPTANTWYHITFVQDATKIYLYVNGVLNTSTTATTTLSQVSSIATIGCEHINGSSIGTYFSGKLNDFRVWNGKALSPKEIEILSRGLVAHYPLDNNGSGQPNLYDFESVANKWAVDGLTLANATDEVYGNVLKITSPSSVSSQRIYRTVSNVWKADTKFTVSFLAKASKTAVVKMSRSLANYAPDVTVGTTWKRYSTVITCSTTVEGGTLSIQTSTASADIYLTQIKLELGDKATAYCPGVGDSHYIPLGYGDTTEYDVSGYQNNGIKTDALTYSSDTPRYSISTIFDANTDNITPSSFYSLGQTIDEMSVSMWFKTNTLNSTQPNLWSLGENSFVRMRLASATSLWYYAKVGAMSGNTSTYTTKALTDNTWHHVVYTFKAGIVTVYLDGVQVGTTNHSGNGKYMTCSSISWHIGGYSSNAEKFIGSLSDFRIYATALSATQVAELYNTAVSVANNGTLMGYELVEG